MSQNPVPDPLPDSVGVVEDSIPHAGAGEVAPRSIFRTQAIEEHARNQERAVFPRLVSPHSFAILWILAILLMAMGLLIAFWPILSPILDGAP